MAITFAGVKRYVTYKLILQKDKYIHPRPLPAKRSEGEIRQSIATCIALWLLLFALSLNAQHIKKPKLLAGPVIGTVTKNSAKIWIAYHSEGHNVLILGDTAEKKVYYPTSYSYINDKRGNVALTMNFTGLKPGHRYNILISIGQWGTNARYSFKTPVDSAVKDFNFLTGSCALMNTDITRGIFPGIANWIFYRMRKKKSDFMVWLGNSTYYFYPKQYRSYEDMFKRELKIRRYYYKIYKDFLANQPNYTIWDEHDYGGGGADKDFALKDSSLKIFKGFWPNTYPDGPKFNGNYFSFREYDAEFFMLDDRYFREHPGDSAAMLGETQLIWLKHKLLSSDATFKFICIGSAVLNDNNVGESYAQYPKERNALFDFIAANNIKGVIFLSGAKHYSEVSKRVWNGYPIYDFTCSSLTALPHPLPLKLLGFYHNRWRVRGTEFPFRNFGRVSVTGASGNRSLKVEVFGRAGHVQRSLVIDQKELQKN